MLILSPYATISTQVMINAIKDLISFIVNIDEHLAELVQSTGSLSYIIVFLIIFMETGFVVTPFLPGDSLLFGLGAISATGSFNIWLLYPILLVAAVTGDSTNYWIGKKVGPKAFKSESRFLNKKHLEKARSFYEKHGGKAIIISRFVPVVRTFAPFVAGIASMNYKQFLTFNLVGGFAWITLFLWAGYFFGNIPFVQDNFHLVIIAIILISLIPIVVEYVKDKRESRKSKSIER